MKWLLVAMLVLTGCGDLEQAEPEAPQPVSRPGDDAVYQRIERMKDCDKLQEQFDIAMDNVERYPAGSDERDAPMGYAEAADLRMQEVDCY